MRDTTKQAIDNIMDVFTGADGGVDFVMFKGFIETLDYQAQQDSNPSLNISSNKILEVLFRFSKLLDIAKSGGNAQTS